MDNVTGIFLRKEVEELRKKGETWGLSKEEIDEAILRALGERPLPDSKAGSKTKTKKRSCLSCCLQVAGFIILLPILLYMVVSLLSIASPKFTLYIGRATADLQYPLQRVVRLISLPFHRFYDFSQLSAWECMVDNPLFVPEKPDCALCQAVKKVARRSSANMTKNAFKKRYYDTGYPVVIRNMPAYGDDTEHSFEKFMELFHANQADLEQDACEFYINGGFNESIKNLAEFLEGWNHIEPAGNTISWKVCYGKGLRMLRTLFPRPYCIHSEGALDKSIYLLQPAKQLAEGVTEAELNSESGRGTFDNIWIAQVTGSTNFTLMPIDDCENDCERFEFTLERGDVFFYSQHTWMTTFYNLGNEPAMLFSSSFA